MEQQTAVEWFWIHLPDNIYKEYFDLFQQANQIFEKQIINAVKYGCSDWGSAKDAEQYYNETYGGQGTDDTKQIKEEQIDKDLFYQKQVMNPYSTEAYAYTAYEKGFMDCAKWMKEQILNQNK